MKNSLGNIGHDAHFGGALAGYFLTILMAPSLIETQLWIVALLSVPLLLLFILIKLKKI
jgi:membrane associated rhomboid family serine protease